MQEYVEERTVAISVKAGKLSGRALAAACKIVLAEMKRHHEAAKRPHGRQSVKKLMNHYGTKSAMTLVGAPKDFDRIANVSNKSWNPSVRQSSATTVMGSAQIGQWSTRFPVLTPCCNGRTYTMFWSLTSKDSLTM